MSNDKNQGKKPQKPQAPTNPQSPVVAGVNYSPIAAETIPSNPIADWDEPVIVFAGISLEAGDCLIVGVGSSTVANNATFAGNQMNLGCFSAGPFSTSILWFQASAAITGDVAVLDHGNQAISAFASKANGLMVPAVMFSATDNAATFNPTASDAPVNTSFPSGLLVGITGSNATQIATNTTTPDWQNNWSEGQIAQQVGSSITEGYKIFSTAEPSQAKIGNLAVPGAYQTCHCGFQAS